MEGSAHDASPHVDTTLTFSSAKETIPLPYVWSYGMGAESTAAIHRMLTHPDTRPATIAPDFTNLVIVIAQTGDEWSTTGELVEQHMLPLLRKHNVRLVEVARNGPTKKDGITVLQDTRQPRRLHLDGVFKLSDENRATGTMPQLGGVRKCSQKVKGAPLDMWRANEFGDRQYYHAIGFNHDEYTRIKRDKAYSMGGQRIPTYPIYEWRWTRQDCIAYLKRELNVDWEWPKSCCRQCPFAGCNTAGWPEQLARFIALPDEAVQHVIDEYVCLALNPRSGLFGPGKSLITRLQRDHATEVIKLAAKRMRAMPWAMYRVRRYFSAPASAIRSLERVLVADRLLLQAALEEISDLVGVKLVKNTEITGAPVRQGDRDTYRRLWLRKRTDGAYPAMEEFYVTAPAQAVDKALDSFDATWTDNTDKLLSYMERRTDAAIAIVRQAINRGANNTAS